MSLGYVTLRLAHALVRRLVTTWQRTAPSTRRMTVAVLLMLNPIVLRVFHPLPCLL